MKIYKFGGGILKDAKAIQELVHFIPKPEELDEKMVIVVSAIGKTTNQLEELVRTAVDEPHEISVVFKRFHDSQMRIAQDCLYSSKMMTIRKLEEVFREIEMKLGIFKRHPFDVFYDQIVPYGEVISSIIVSAFLNENGFTNKLCDSRKSIKTNSRYRQAEVLDAITVEKLRIDVLLDLVNKIFIFQGFIGSDDKNFTTTLGREGSDYTTAIIASAINMTEMVIWKDVNGIYSADPKKYVFAEQIPEMSYDEAEEMTDLGAKVLHPKTLKPLREAGIKLHIKKYALPITEGTIIEDVGDKIQDVPIIAHRENLVRIDIMPRKNKELDMDMRKFLSQNFYKNNIVSHYTTADKTLMKLYVNHDPVNIHHLMNELEKDYSVIFEPGFELINIKNPTDELLDIIKSREKIEVETKASGITKFIIKT